MLKSISNLGAVLNKADQKKINGGAINCPEGTRYTCYTRLINGVLKTVYCHCLAIANPYPDLDM
ncbi:hypothetical protein [Tenacibaculum xiamenense]|uniref:hypothetical protein n=1 Tax=Tenacibaculum xiamenense TaxID=1261553 RepID=UPI0038B474C3